MQISVVQISSGQRDEFEKITISFNTSNGYKWLSQNELPSIVPDSLRKKLTSALIMWERLQNDCVMIICNNIRVHKEDNHLDQQPFGIAVYENGASTTGIFLDHGNWTNRTVPITSEVRLILESTGLDKYFPLSEMASNSSGPLSDLRGTSHEGAFKTVLSEILRSRSC